MHGPSRESTRLPGARRCLLLLGLVLSVTVPVHPCHAAEVGEAGEEVASSSLSGYIELRGIYAFDHDTPTEDPSAELGIELKARSSSWNSIKIVLQAVQDGKVIEPSGTGAFQTFNDVYQDRTPSVSIDEAYIDIFTGDADFRLGVQKFAWGRLDEINPTDNLNTEDLTEGGLNDEVERKIGVPAVKANLYADLANIEIAWVPFFVPYRLPEREERWFPGVLVPPEKVEVGSSVGTVPVATSYVDMNLPARTVRNSEAGIRVSRHIEGWDVSACYFTGYDPMPLTDAAVDVDITLVDPLSLAYRAESRVTLEPVVHRIHVFGFDFTTTVSDFTVRAEYAYFHNKRFNRKLESVLDELVTKETIDGIYSDFLVDYFASAGSLTRQSFRLNPKATLTMDSMKYGAGIDYIYGDTSVSVQLIQEYVPDHTPDMPVYFVKDGFDTLATFLLKQFFLQNTLEINLRTAYDMEFHDYVVKPSVKYHFTDRLAGTVGLILIGGKEDDSLFGQFRENDQVYAQIRCAL